MRIPVLVGLALVGSLSGASAATPPITVLTGKGAQIYGCAKAGAGYAWRLKAPDAVLTDAAGHRVGRHFAGPSWQAEDGGTVVGDPLASGASPQPGAVPWLVLRAKARPASGLFAGVSYVVRGPTEGGVAPVAGCDAAHAGAETRVDYSATYTFFR